MTDKLNHDNDRLSTDMDNHYRLYVVMLYIPKSRPTAENTAVLRARVFRKTGK